MEYRHLPHGGETENLGVLGLGMGGMQEKFRTKQSTRMKEIAAYFNK